MYRSRINRLFAVAIMAAAASFDWIVGAIASTGASLSRRATDIAIRIVSAAPDPMAPPGAVAKSPSTTSTAEQRMWLVTGRSHQATMHAKRHPTIEPGWRMCAST